MFNDTLLDQLIEKYSATFSNNLVVFPTPEEVLAIGEGSIKNVGVSQAKIRYIRNVAQAFVNKNIVIEEIQSMSDDEVVLRPDHYKGSREVEHGNDLAVHFQPA